MFTKRMLCARLAPNYRYNYHPPTHQVKNVHAHSYTSNSIASNEGEPNAEKREKTRGDKKKLVYKIGRVKKVRHLLIMYKKVEFFPENHSQCIVHTLKLCISAFHQ